MNKIIFGVLAFLILTACGSNSNSESSNTIEEAKIIENTERPQADPSLTIYKNRVGEFGRGKMLDMALLDPNATLKDAKQHTENTKKYYTVSRNGKEALRIYPAYDIRTGNYSKLIGSVEIVSPDYLDIHGAAIGWSVKDFFDTYPLAISYYKPSTKEVILTNQGQGPQFIVSSTALKGADQIPVGKINAEMINQNATIELIRLVRSEQENEQAKLNPSMEDKMIVESFFESILGKYYLSGFSENYYKIHSLQGDYFVSECFEGECNQRGKIIASNQFRNGQISLELEGISGAKVPSWSIQLHDNGTHKLYVYDYNADEDSWSDRIFTRGNK